MNGLVKHTFLTIAAFLLLILVLEGCKNPAPVELIDDEIRSPEVELVNEPFAPQLGTEDVDSSGLFPSEPRKTFGHMLLSGSVYDGVFQHREATLARAVFFDRTNPVLNSRGDTVAYKTIDVGTLSLDGYGLRKHPKRFSAPRSPIDTLLGVQYSLTSGAGIGISFGGNRRYRWQNPATNLSEPLDISFLTPEQLLVTQPTPSDVISRSQNLAVQWQGGANTIRIVISDIAAGSRSKPLVNLRVGRNRGEVIIPSSILRLLPKNRAGFLFTFSSERSSLLQVNGYPDNVLVQGMTNHSLYLQCGP